MRVKLLNDGGYLSLADKKFPIYVHGEFDEDGYMTVHSSEIGTYEGDSFYYVFNATEYRIINE